MSEETTQTIKTTHEGVEIIYFETPNTWRFTVNGRERSAESLTKARESIDRALYTVKKEKPWEPFEAYFEQGYDATNFKKVKVTSIAERNSWQSNVQVWISCNGQRSKEPAHKLYTVCSENEKLIAEIQRLYRQSQELEEQIREARSKMVNVEIPSTD